MFESINEARKTITALKDSLARESEPNNELKGAMTDADIFSMISALQQMFDIAEAVEQQEQVLTADEITDIGEQGLTLIDNLVYSLVSKNMGSHRQDVEQVALIIAQWVITNHGRLNNIQSVVDGLAYLANALQDQAMLVQLTTFIGQVAQACSDVIQHDLDNVNPARPWRVMNLNRGIVATRSHDLELMRVVFTGLIQALPLDAPGFFKEGMSEMVRLNYPQPVHELMQEFHQQTKLPAVH